ncbi:MAG: hypothetical protein OK439_04595 [Thaumarchaeota archaeon]|nr:hypothetical protein [Nitrososphaerota archaeon]
MTDSIEFAKLAGEDLKYKIDLEKNGKIVSGGPFLDIVGDFYVLETSTIEEMGEIFFESPSNLLVEREVHPLGSFKDSYEGMKELAM